MTSGNSSEEAFGVWKYPRNIQRRMIGVLASDSEKNLDFNTRAAVRDPQGGGRHQDTE